MASLLDLAAEVKTFENSLTKRIRSVLKKYGKLIVQRASQNHRYKNRKHNLRKAQSYELRITPDSVIMDLDLAKRDKIANKYAIYVHEGHGTWKPDPFFQQAIEHYLPRLEAELDDMRMVKFG